MGGMGLRSFVPVFGEITYNYPRLTLMYGKRSFLSSPKI